MVHGRVPRVRVPVVDPASDAVREVRAQIREAAVSAAAAATQSVQFLLQVPGHYWARAHPSGGSVELTANYRWGFMKEDEITGAKGLLSQSAGSGLLSTNTIWWICYCILACRDILEGKCCYLLKVISTLEQYFCPLFERGLEHCQSAL